MCVAYGSETILESISLCLHSGEFVGIIGPNGAGKTTLLRVILGLLAPTEGTVHAQWKRIGYIPQRGAVTGGQVPVSVAEVVGMGGPGVASALGEVMLDGFGPRRFDALSGGQQQRVLIAKALAGRPDVLILDEPTTGIDESAQREFFTTLDRLHERGMTIVMVSHDVEAVVRQVSRVICLNRRIIFDGPPQNFELDRFLPEMYGTAHRALHHRHEAGQS